MQPGIQSAHSHRIATALARFDWRAAVVAFLLIAALGAALSFLLTRQIRAQAIESAQEGVVREFVPHLLTQLTQADLRDGIRPERRAELDAFLANSILSERILGVRIWDGKGQIVAETVADPLRGEEEEYGRKGGDDDLATALAGGLRSSIRRDGTAGPDPVPDLIETYAPLRFAPSAAPAGAFEIYQDYSLAAGHIEEMKHLALWGLASGLLITYLLLGLFVQRRHSLIRRQTRLLEEQRDWLRELAFRDPLTGLPNRRSFFSHLEMSLAAMGPDGTLAVILVDIDHLEAINNSLGRPAGDALLRDVAARLQGAVPAGRAWRISGDEFAIALAGLNRAHAAGLARDILARFDTPFRHEGRETSFTVSLGVAVADRHLPADALLRSADVALYLAAAVHGNSYRVADEQSVQEWLRRRELERDLAGAVERNELVLHYQPVVDLRTGRPTGMEALVRWQHPVHGRLPPDEFIGLAESTGRIVEVDRWVRSEAFAQTKRWLSTLPGLAGFRIRINLSAVDLEQHDLVWDVARALREAELDGSSVELEVTETAIMREAETMLKRLRSLADLEIGLAIDDFGTGYSSLAYLRDMPATALKIDRSFVTGLTDDPVSQTLVKTMVDLGRSLGFTVIAEGIETAEQEAILAGLGCDLGQGYLYGRPLDRTDATEFLAKAQTSRRPEGAQPAG